MAAPLSPDHEPAYQAWVYACRGDMQCVHAETGTPLATLYRWKVEQNWVERKQRELIPELYNMMTDIKTDVSLAMKDVVPALLSIVRKSIDESKVISASRALNEVYRTLVSSQLVENDAKVVEVMQRSSAAYNGDVTPIDIIEANVNAAEATTKTRRR